MCAKHREHVDFFQAFFCLVLEGTVDELMAVISPDQVAMGVSISVSGGCETFTYILLYTDYAIGRLMKEV